MAKRTTKKVYLPEHYTSIDFLPILYWEKIHENGDMRFLLTKPKKLTKAQKIELRKVWTEIYNEYIKVFGYSDNFQRIIEKNLQISRLKLKLILTNDPKLNNLINKKSTELEVLKNYNSGGGDIYKAKMAIEAKNKVYIPLATISVREFYSYIKELK